MRQDPTATWTYPDPVRFGETVMVFCAVTAFGKTMQAQLPVMDYRNKAIPNPDAFAVNTAMQRCMVKAIALHGLGLYIYAGEDLPVQEAAHRATPTAGAWDIMDDGQKEALTEIAAGVMDKMADPKAAMQYLEDQGLSADEKVALWTKFDSKTRAALKKAKE